MSTSEGMDVEARKVTERIVVVIATGVSIAYVVLLVIPSGWHVKVTQIWSFYIGLFNVTIKADSIGSYLIKSIIMLAAKATKSNGPSREFVQKLLDILDPEEAHDIQGLRDALCNIEMLAGGFFNNCQVWSYVLYGSWIMAISLLITIVLLMAGSCLLLASPTKCVRWTSFCMFSMAAVVNLLGLGGYIALSFQLQRWLVEIYGSHGGLTFSVASIACAGLTLLVCLIPAMVFACTNLPRGHIEDDWDQQNVVVDAYGNPMLVDANGVPIQVDQYGNQSFSGPPSQYDQPYDPYAQQQQQQPAGSW